MSDSPDDAEAIQLAMTRQLNEDLQAIVGRAYGPMFQAYKELYLEERGRSPALPEVALGGAFVGTLLHVAAAIAVGLGMRADTFAASAMESYKAAHAKAPKWG